MDTKTYEVKLKALKTNPEISCELSAMRGKKKVSVLNKKMETDLESIFLTDANHSVAKILTGSDEQCTLKEFNTRFRSTSNLTNLSYAFQTCTQVEQIDVSGIDISNVKTLEYTFGYCRKLKTIDLSNWNTSKVTNFHCMFYDCRVLERIDGIIDMTSMPRIMNGANIDQFEGAFHTNSNNLRGVKLKNVPDNFMDSVSAQRGSRVTHPGYQWCGFTSPDQFEIVS